MSNVGESNYLFFKVMELKVLQGYSIDIFEEATKVKMHAILLTLANNKFRQRCDMR